MPEDKQEWATRHAEHIARETLATSFEVSTAGEGAHKVVEGVSATVAKNG